MKTSSPVAPEVHWWVDDGENSQRHAVKAMRDADLWVATLITSEVFRRRSAPSELLWQLLSIPQHFVELAFTPLAIIVTAVERNRVDRRVRDFLRNDSGTVKVTPQFKIAVGDGAGGGAALSLDGIGGGDTHLRGLARVNGDFEATFQYERRLAFLEGRVVRVAAFRERDQNLRYYDLSNSTTSADRRVLGGWC